MPIKPSRISLPDGEWFGHRVRSFAHLRQCVVRERWANRRYSGYVETIFFWDYLVRNSLPHKVVGFDDTDPHTGMRIIALHLWYPLDELYTQYQLSGE